MKTPSNIPTSMHRDTDTQAKYVSHIQHKVLTNDTSCDMCRLIKDHRIDMGKDLQHVCIIPNEFPYSVYDGSRAVVHHMLVPTEHYASSSELPEEVKQELRDTQDALLGDGTYDSALVRSTHSPTLSVRGHMHIHLIKLGEKIIRQDYDAYTGKNDIKYE
jgi:hypothetical protein